MGYSVTMLLLNIIFGWFVFVVLWENNTFWACLGGPGLKIHAFSNVVSCSTLPLWVGYFIYFKFAPVLFQLMLFNSIKQINRLKKEVNRVFSKGMSNINLKVTIEKKWRTPNLDFLILKSFSTNKGRFLGNLNLRRYYWTFKFLVATSKSEFWEQHCVWLFHYFYFKRNYGELCWTKI